MASPLFLEELRRLIQTAGPMPVSRYMDICLPNSATT